MLDGPYEIWENWGKIMEQHNQTLCAVYGALVHDLGKILYRMLHF